MLPMLQGRHEAYKAARRRGEVLGVEPPGPPWAGG